MKTDELREKYLAFFESKGCVRRPSDVLVPRWDPSVLFTPAGMNQFKDHFLGKVKLEFTRATTCQKCLRTGDIDNVGRTAYHHTFFEMLGNFSFGDYFKRDAIHWAWEFLTSPKWLALPAARLTASVYVDDLEAAKIWLDEIKLPSSKVERMGEDDNFWPAGAPSQGPDGVCGPCSEVFYHTDTGSVEIWNLVFTQFNRVGNPPSNLRPLPSKNIDTGMGLERSASVLQGVDSNFHIDILRPLVEAAGEVCGIRYDPTSEHGRRLRRIADHVRACTFAIHEDVYPGPKAEKYVIKRLLRRAVLDGHQIGLRKRFLHLLVPKVVELMRNPYPELRETATRVAGVIEKEESNFFSTIDAGLDRIERLFRDMSKSGRVMVAGEEAADMYTTHGFPPELFETLAAEHNFVFDWQGYRAAMEQHGIESGAGTKTELFRRSHPIDALKKAMHGTDFRGYETLQTQSRVVGIIVQDKLCDFVDEVGHGQPITIVLDKTPFYGESGGQVGDAGELVGDGFRFEVIDSQRDGSFVLHLGHLRSGVIRQGATVTARVDGERRAGIVRAHSATHILHHALRKHLGQHAQQQGSKVDRDWLRFDFANPRPLTREDIRSIENNVNALITAAEPVHWSTMPIAEARKLGAMMLFGEKYPDDVRVVAMGDFSKELCGGTHLANTGQTGLFKIVGEESVAAGTRRITAITGPAALVKVQEQEEALAEVAAILKAPAAEIPARVAALAKEVRDLKKQAARTAGGGEVSAETLLAEAESVAGAKVVVAEVSGGTPPVMRQLIDQMRRKGPPTAALLASREQDKVVLVAGISRELEAKGVHAGNWVRAAAEAVGGSGGGRADMAQAGGKEPDKLPAALEKAREAIHEQLAHAR